MQVPAIDLAAQWRDIADEAEPLLLARARSGNYLGSEAVEAFEQEWAAYVGGGVHAVACSSGTDAVELMVRATTEQHARVSVPSETFVATLGAVERSGRTAVLSGGHVHARIAVWLYGSTADADSIAQECAEAGIPLLEDASQAHGNRLAGRIGLAAAFSLYPSKNLGGIGQGGICTFRHKIHADKARLIREHGYERATDRHVMRGFNLRMDGINADVLRLKLKHLDRYVQRKRNIAQAYTLGLMHEHNAKMLTLPATEAEHAWHQYTPRIHHDKRDSVLADLRTAGIGAMVHYRTTADGRETEWSRETLSLPIGPHLADEQVAYVIEHVKKAVRS